MTKKDLLPCNSCGKCCVKYSATGGLGSITEEEYQRLPDLALDFAYAITDGFLIYGSTMVKR